jgi:phage gp36-like protein
MPYCTRQNLIDRFTEAELIQLTDRANLGVINDSVLNQAISDADNEINGYIAKHLPLATVPPRLVKLACDIARYHLYDDLVPDHVQNRYRDAVAYLSGVSKGQFPLIDDATVIEPDTVNIIDIASSSIVFGRDSY